MQYYIFNIKIQYEQPDMEEDRKPEMQQEDPVAANFGILPLAVKLTGMKLTGTGYLYLYILYKYL